MNRWMGHHAARQHAAEEKTRPVHHSPWFWLGVAMFVAAITSYVFSEDLSLRPRLHGATQTTEGRPSAVP